MRDRRRYIRVPVQVEFCVREGSSDEHGQLFFAGRNVSRGGAFLASDLLLEIDTHLHIRFQLPGLEPITTGALVAWISDGEDGEPGMGISFTTLRPDYLQAIESFILNSPETL